LPESHAPSLDLSTLYRDYARVVHGIVMARAGWRDADDLTQEVFAAAAAKLGNLRDPAAVGGWICAIARNVASDHLRQKMRRPVHASLDGDDVAEPAVKGRTPSELQRRVLTHIRDLPEAYRETLILRLVEGMTGPEIADRTGLTHGSVRVNLSRGMQQLRTRLEAEGWP